MVKFNKNYKPENIQDMEHSVLFSIQQTNTAQSLQENAITRLGIGRTTLVAKISERHRKY